MKYHCSGGANIPFKLIVKVNYETGFAIFYNKERSWGSAYAIINET